MSTKQRIALAVGMFLLLGVLALLGWSYQSRQAPPAQRGAVAVVVTSPEDAGPGSLREALFVVAAAPGKASIAIKTRAIALKTALPPLANPYGLRIVAEQPGVEIDARALAGGPVFDVTGANASIEGLVLRHCPAAAILVRAGYFHLQSSTIESCDVGVDVAESANGLLLEHNRFANGRVGVRFAAASRNSLVTGNTFVHNADAGLWAVRAVADNRDGSVSVRDNHFSGNRSGIVAGNVALVVERNDFAAAGEAAVHLIGSGAVIRGNHISGGTAMGIVAENARNTVIEGNELDHFATYAIMVRGSADALVRANRIHNCGYGLAFVLGDPRSPSTALDNTIIEPAFDGIDVIGDSPILRNNQVLRPHALALHVVDFQPAGGENVGARPLLEGNNFSANVMQSAADQSRDDGRARVAARRQ
jgi:hypothetical protein